MFFWSALRKTEPETEQTGVFMAKTLFYDGGHLLITIIMLPYQWNTEEPHGTIQLKPFESKTTIVMLCRWVQ